uniref:ATP synthase F0 subunit 8 n=1 Tax=Cycetogamasus diviortus TaxID=2978624 RepID=UPI0022F325E6|nr:ATP synthase F0 subunit 8 [Cycetogamasus diviortus]WAK85124.1 ATP synthase F0 subunit 8 [Cycetogamasus diviortus]
MPQMSPMNWLFISPLTLLLCIVLMTIIYFSFNNSQIKSETKPSTKPQKLFLKFKW